MINASRPPKRARSRLWRLCLAITCACLLGWPPGSALASPSDSVRTGTTEPSGSSDPSGTPKSPAQPTSDPHASQAAATTGPDDAPRTSTARFKLPDAPSNFNTYDVGWIRFAYPPSERQWVEPLIRHADRVRTELRERLGFPVLGQLRVYVARTPGEMAALAPEGATVPRYAVGMAFADLGLVLLTLNPLYPNDHHDVVEIFRHEAAHVALHEAVRNADLPHWFDEGFAVHLSDESPLLRLRELSTATVADRLIPLEQLARGFPSDPIRAQLAYAQAADVARFLVRQQDHVRFVALLERIRGGQTFEHALEDAYGTTLGDLELEWQKDVAKRYTFWPVLLSGSLVWVGALGVLVWGWRRRKTRDRATLARWAREEAREDALREASVPSAPVRVHVVLARPQAPSAEVAPSMPELEVPKVQHEGQWHTLH